MKFALLFGGASFEHEISIVSAIALKDVLKKDHVFIFLDADGNFFHIPSEKMKSDHFSNGGYKKDTKLTLVRGGFEKKGVFKTSRFEEWDIIINLVHGAQGEDGTLSSLLDFYDLPYIGPRKEASVISFNKWLGKLYAKDLGIKCVEFVRLNIDGNRTIPFDFPVIVKPLRLGSSIGVSVAKDKKELDFALDVAFEFDDEVLVEPFLENIAEYNVAGCYAKGKWHIGSIEAPSRKEFLDFEQKYLDFSRTHAIEAAPINEELKEMLEEAFKRLYDPLFAGALVRCDFFVKDGKIFINEINPIPGSLANYLFEDFISVLRDLAKSLPKSRKIRPDYAYIERVQSAKGPKTRYSS